ncbi:MAG: riboflavin biosynthesis protein RibD, partial [Planctomycetota bacterium]
LVEGGSALLGNLFDLDQIDEVHAFVAPKIIGGREGFTPVGGRGRESMDRAIQLADIRIEKVGNDVYLTARVKRKGLAINPTTTRA